jgi:MSHA biogenesis protein MshG
VAETYEFTARDKAGTQHKGTVSGASSASVARDLVAKGFVPIDIRVKSAVQAVVNAQAASSARAAAAAEASASGSGAAPRRAGAPAAAPAAFNFNFSWMKASSGAKKKRAQANFSIVLRELAALLRAGVPLLRALQLAADSTADEHVRSGLLRIQRDLDNGHNLSAAADHEHRLTGLLSPYDVAMIQVGEQTGRLPECFADLYRQREFVRSTNEQVASALRYPAFVLLTCAMAVVVVNLFVLPSFAKVFAQSRAPLPVLTQVLMGASALMLKWWPIGISGAVGLVFAWKRWTATEAGLMWWDKNKLRLPIVGKILEGIVLSRLAGALSSAITAGLTINDGLNVAARTLDNTWFESRLQRMRNDLARGSSISAAARNMGVLPSTMLQLFTIGEESGSLEELMREIAVHYQTEVDYAIKRLSATLEPILIWFLGMGVLVLALGVFMPMWDLGRATVK